MRSELPAHVKIVEVGPRDGLQNEPERIPTEIKSAFIEALVRAGLKWIEATSFVNPKAVPRMADAEDVARCLPRATGVAFSALAPNLRGLERAIDSGIQRIAVFTAASETFAKKNINMGVDESLEVFQEVVAGALRAGLTARGYVSTCFVCPYEGEIDAERVCMVAARLLDMGVDEVSISDTIGAAVPTDVEDTVGRLLSTIPVEKIALHFHDTYGTALANVAAGLRLGISTFDASAGGLGGCPFAPGATGNLATEDLVYMLERMGIDTGVDLGRLADASRVIAEAVGRDLPSRQLARLNAARALGRGA